MIRCDGHGEESDIENQHKESHPLLIGYVTHATSMLNPSSYEESRTTWLQQYPL